MSAFFLLKKVIKKIYFVAAAPFRAYRNYRIPNKVYVLVHCPRSGGTHFKQNICRFVGNYLKGEVYMSKFNASVARRLLSSNRKACFYLDHCQIDPCDFFEDPRIEYICLVRQPIERLKSRYFYNLNFNEVKAHKTTQFNFTFQEYVIHLLRYGGDNMLVRQLCGKLPVGIAIDNGVIPDNTVPIQPITLDDAIKALSILSKFTIVNTTSLSSFLSDKFLIPPQSRKSNASLKKPLTGDQSVDKVDMSMVTYYDELIYQLLFESKSKSKSDIATKTLYKAFKELEFDVYTS